MRLRPWSTPLLILAMLAGSCDSCGSPESGGDGQPEDPHHARNLAEGHRLYAQYCALCHGPTGEGYAADYAPQLANPMFLQVATDEFLRDAIANGRPGTAMSAWSRLRGGPLSGDDIHKLVTLIRSWQTEPTEDVRSVRVQGDPQRAELVYRDKCMECHGPDGSGTKALSINNPRFLTSASDGFLQFSILHGRPGTDMPAFEDELPAQTIDDLVMFLRTRPRQLQPEHPVEEVQVDYSRIVLNPEGPDPRFHLREDLYVAADDVKAALDAHKKMVVLDARATSDWLQGHIPGSVPVPFYDMEPLIDALPRDGTMIVAYCGCPHAASGRVVAELRRREFPTTAVLDEGIGFWMERGYPTKSGGQP